MSRKEKTPLRVQLAFWILCFVFAASAVSCLAVQKQCGRLHDEAEALLSLVQSDAEQEALDAAVLQFSTHWTEAQPMLRLILSGNVLSDLGRAISRLPAETAHPDMMRAELPALESGLMQVMRQERSVF